MPPALRGLRLNLVALTALALISEGPKHPYEIQRVIRLRHHVHAMGRTRALYHAVDRLARYRLIEPLETMREGRRPERTVYQITPAGSDELQAWIVDLLLAPAERPDLFWVAIGFVVYLDPDLVRRTLEERHRNLEVSQASHGGIRAALRDMGLPRSILLDGELRAVLVDAEMAWLRGVIADLAGGGLAWSPHASPIELDDETRARLEARYMIE
jgi:DNA-binding PadR family transcriptional regulator